MTIANASAIGTLVGAHLGDESLIDVWFERAGNAIEAYPDSDSAAGYAELLVRRGKPMEARIALRRAVPNCVRIRRNMRTLIALAKYGAAEDFDRARALLATAADSKSDVPEKPALELFDAYVAHRVSELERAHAAPGDQSQDGRKTSRLRLPKIRYVFARCVGNATLGARGRVGASRRSYRMYVLRFALSTISSRRSRT